MKDILRHNTNGRTGSGSSAVPPRRLHVALVAALGLALGCGAGTTCALATQAGSGVTDVTVISDGLSPQTLGADEVAEDGGAPIRSLPSENLRVVTTTAKATPAAASKGTGPLAKTGEDALVGTAALIGAVGGGIGAAAILARQHKKDDKGDGNEE